MAVLSSIPSASLRNQKFCPASRPVMKNSDWGGTVTYFGTCTLLSNTCPCLLVHLRVFPAACTTGELKSTIKQWLAKNSML